MNLSNSDIAKDVRKYCAKIGLDPLLVQGAGGNVSWKDGDTLWIKASGKWLVRAELEEIFVPVDLKDIKCKLQLNHFDISPKVISTTLLKPSIETSLHAIMPHKIVVHLHAIEALAHLVHSDFREFFKHKLNDFHNFECIDYFKPGTKLAQAVFNLLQEHPNIDIIFMKNHGIVIGGDSVNQIDLILKQISSKLAVETLNNHLPKYTISKVPMELSKNFYPIKNKNLSLLALIPSLFKRLSTAWCLYPDHVVFLGPCAYSYTSWETALDEILLLDNYPELIFILGQGVYTQKSFSNSKLIQLQCFLDILVRQDECQNLSTLSEKDVLDLLNWDAEIYRINLSKSN